MRGEPGDPPRLANTALHMSLDPAHHEKSTRVPMASLTVMGQRPETGVGG